MGADHDLFPIYCGCDGDFDPPTVPPKEDLGGASGALLPAGGVVRMEPSADCPRGIWSHDPVWGAGHVVSPLNGESPPVYPWSMDDLVCSPWGVRVEAGAQGKA